MRSATMMLGIALTFGCVGAAFSGDEKKKTPVTAAARQAADDKPKGPVPGPPTAPRNPAPAPAKPKTEATPPAPLNLNDLKKTVDAIDRIDRKYEESITLQKEIDRRRSALKRRVTAGTIVPLEERKEDEAILKLGHRRMEVIKETQKLIDEYRKMTQSQGKASVGKK